METLKVRIHQLLQQLNEQVFGKEHVVSLALLSAVAGESIFLLGPPGVAKSMVARRLKLAFREGTSFEYLMSRFSTPDELFGPVSISRLKDDDIYERVTEGYLPSATVVFLDEIWKAGPAIQNSLLTVINEKKYRNGRFEIKVPLKGLVAASNELPASGQGLEALWDRFLVRVLVGGIEDLSDFDRMIASVSEEDPEVDPALAIGEEEYAGWQRKIAEVKIHYSIFEVIHLLKEEIEEYNHRQENADAADLSFYVSDRRWKKLVKLLRASAFLNGEETIHLSDCLLLMYGLWNEVGQMDLVEEMVSKAIRRSAEGYLLNLKGIDDELRSLKDELASDAVVRENEDPGLQLVDQYYYQVERVRMAGKLLIFASDYQLLDDRGKQFCLQKDKYKSACFVLKKYDASLHGKVPQNKIYTLRRGRRSVFINDYEYPLLCVPGCMPLPPVEVRPQEDMAARFAQLEQKLQRVENDCEDLFAREKAYCESHLFLSARQREIMRKMLTHHQADVAGYRNELNELKHAYRKENEEYPAEGSENTLSGAASH